MPKWSSYRLLFGDTIRRRSVLLFHRHFDAETELYILFHGVREVELNSPVDLLTNEFLRIRKRIQIYHVVIVHICTGFGDHTVILHVRNTGVDTNTGQCDLIRTLIVADDAIEIILELRRELRKLPTFIFDFGGSLQFALVLTFTG